MVCVVCVSVVCGLCGGSLCSVWWGLLVCMGGAVGVWGVCVVCGECVVGK